MRPRGARRSATIALAVLAIGCEADPTASDPAGAPVVLQLDASGVDPVEFTPVLSKVDRVGLQITSEQGTTRDTTAAVEHQGGRLRARILLYPAEMTPGVTVRAELRSGAGVLFAGTAREAQAGAPILVPIQPVPDRAATGLPAALAFTELGQLPLGGTVDFVTGDPVPGLQPTWTSSDPRVVDVGTDRVARVLSNGTAILTVRHGALFATATVRVAQVAHVLTAVQPADTTLAWGDTIRFRGLGTDRGGHALQPGAFLDWVVQGSAAAVDEGGLVRATGLQTGPEEAVFVHPRAHPDLAARVTVVRGPGNPRPSEVAFAKNGRITFGDRSGPGTILAQEGATQPSWAPNHADLAFVRAGRLHLATWPSGERPLPTPGLTSIRWPEFSADGDWIYFAAGADNGPGIFRIRRDGSALERVSAEPGDMPSTSPGTSELVYTRGSDLVAQRAGTPPRVLLRDVVPHNPKWSPDGQWIAFVSRSVWLVRPDGTGLRSLTPFGYYRGVSWSPDGRYLLAISNTAHVIEVATGTVTRMVWGGESDDGVSWWR